MAKPPKKIVPPQNAVPFEFHKQEHEATPYAMRLVDMGLLHRNNSEFNKIRDAIATMHYYGMDGEKLEKLLGYIGDGRYTFDKLWYHRNPLNNEDLFEKFRDREGISRQRVEEALHELTDALGTVHERTFRGLKGANPKAYFSIREAILNRIREYDLQKHPEDIKIDAAMKGKYIELLEHEPNYNRLAFLLGINFRDAYHYSDAIVKEIHSKRGRFWHPDLYEALLTLKRELEKKEEKEKTTT